MPDPTNEYNEAADKLERHAPHCTVTTAIAMREAAAMLRKVGPLVEFVRKVADSTNWSCSDFSEYHDHRLHPCNQESWNLDTPVIELAQHALAAFKDSKLTPPTPEPNREHDAAEERTRVAES